MQIAVIIMFVILIALLVIISVIEHKDNKAKKEFYDKLNNYEKAIIDEYKRTKWKRKKDK